MFKKFRIRRHHDAEGPHRDSLAPALPIRTPSSDSTSLDWNQKRRSSAGQTVSASQVPHHLRSESNQQGVRDRSPSPLPGAGSRLLGLRIVHQPIATAPVDIIFVHGLGGNSRDTWSKNHDPNLCWPELWLPLETNIELARILSFGYNAGFRAGTAKSTSNVADFAKELLHEMRFGRDSEGAAFDVGNVPIIFVAHSMGGLVAKKAYLLGQIDGEYEDIIRSISAMVFLATPHRGSNLAEVLNRILGASFQSTRRFIDDINTNSSALEDINDQFRHVAPKLSVFSFYETLATKVGPKRLMVVEKDSAILGYTREVSRALNADHHNVCKFSSREDENYISVRNVLTELVDRLRPRGADNISSQRMETIKNIEKVFSISSSSEDDLDLFSRSRMKGTCEWIVQEPHIANWLDDTTPSQVTWLTAPPATGKSVLATFLISYLREKGASCQFFFFRFGDQTKRLINDLLRSIAYQFASDNRDFWRIVGDQFDSDLRLDKLDPVLVWQRLFDAIILKMDLKRPIYWIIDALDEAESPKILIDLFKGIKGSMTPIHILVISRKSEQLQRSFDQLCTFIPVSIIHRDGQHQNNQDIKLFVEHEMQMMRGDEAFRQRVASSVVEGAEGNFLWTRLVMEEVLNCHTEEAIQETLDEIPSDMNALYRRMEHTILNIPRKSDRRLARELLMWTIFTRRAMALEELAQALQAEFHGFIDLRRTIQDVCGQFILVDSKGRVSMVHQTARDYIISLANEEICIKPKQAHTHLLSKTLSYLTNEDSRFRLTQDQQSIANTDPFLMYTATSWPYHLQHIKAADNIVIDTIVEFFRSPCVLIWIHVLALVGQLQCLIKASKALFSFVKVTRKLNSTRNPLLHRLSDLTFLDQWATDLVRLAGRYSRQLEACPTAIYNVVPAICPDNSMLRKQFYGQELSEISLKGTNNAMWTDHFVKLSLPDDEAIWNIVCTGQYVAVLGSTGKVYVYDARNFSEICIASHSEPVTALAFNDKCTRLVTYGSQQTKLWSVPLGELLSSTPNPGKVRAMTISFTENDSRILCGGEDKNIRVLDVDDHKKGWQIPAPRTLKENPQLEGSVINAPVWMEFNKDATQVGVAYRGFPLSVWSLSESRCIARCRRSKAFRNEQGRPSTSWFAVDRFTWNPITSHIIGIYKDGSIFKWHPITDETHEAQSSADEIAASPDGRLFLTSDSNGTIRVWNFSFFSVIYQLRSGDLVTGLSFSPDCRRFYDVRGSFINAWEPSSLAKLSEPDDAESDTGSEEKSMTSFSHVSDAHVAQYELVTAVAVAPNELMYCLGNEEGVVTITTMQENKTFELLRFLNYLSINQLAWSTESNILAATDLSGEVAVRRIGKQIAPGDSQVEVLAKPQLDLEGRGIHQMFFSSDKRSLVFISDDLAQISKIYDGSVSTTSTLDHASSRRWCQHPFQSTLLLAFGPEDLIAFNLENLDETVTIGYQAGRQQLSSQLDTKTSRANPTNSPILSKDGTLHSQTSTLSVQKLVISHDHKCMLVQIEKSLPTGRATKTLLCFETADLPSSCAQGTIKALPYRQLSRKIGSNIQTSLAVLPGPKLVFLDQDLWVCTYPLGPSYKHIEARRHYFIPRDWTTPEGLEQISMAKDGTLFCLKDDRVVEIRSSILTTDI